MKQPYDIEFFERLYQNEVTDSERNTFETDLKKDTSLQKEKLDAFRIFEGMKQLRINQYSLQVAAWENEAVQSIDTETEMLEAYLTDQLDDEEREFVEELIQKKPELKDSLSTLQQTLEGFRGLRVQNMQEEVAGWEKEIAAKAKSTRKSEKPQVIKRNLWRRPLMSIAAALAIFVVSAHFITRSNLSDAALADKYYSIPISETLRSTEDLNTTFQTAVNMIKTGQVEEGYEVLQKILDLNPVDEQALLYQSFALYEQNKFKEALNGLKSIKSVSTDVLMEIDWLMALCQLKLQNPTQEIRQQLLSISQNESNPHRLEANELLTQINSFWRIFI